VVGRRDHDGVDVFPVEELSVVGVQTDLTFAGDLSACLGEVFRVHIAEGDGAVFRERREVGEPAAAQADVPGEHALARSFLAQQASREERGRREPRVRQVQRKRRRLTELWLAGAVGLSCMRTSE
jgi:hypothetical protein